MTVKKKRLQKKGSATFSNLVLDYFSAQTLPQNKRDNHELDGVQDAIVVREVSAEDGKYGVTEADKEIEDPEADRRVARCDPRLDTL